MELAIVLMIIGTLMSGVLVAVSRSMADARITRVQAQLREIEEALYGYAQAYGRLPCPATDDSVPANFSDTACDKRHGFVPSGTIGIDGPVNAGGLLVDPWGNPLRYSLILDPAVGTPDFSDTANLKASFVASSALTSANMFKVCDDAACSNTFANTVPAVVMSLGPNFGSYTHANEIMNAGDQMMDGYPIKDDVTFVNATYSEDNFDDQVVWLSPYILFDRLVRAGKLP